MAVHPTFSTGASIRLTFGIGFAEGAEVPLDRLLRAADAALYAAKVAGATGSAMRMVSAQRALRPAEVFHVKQGKPPLVP